MARPLRVEHHGAVYQKGVSSWYCNIVLDTGSVSGKVPDMARPLRIEHPGAVYHVMNRGDRGLAVFKGGPLMSQPCNLLKRPLFLIGRIDGAVELPGKGSVRGIVI